MFYISNILDGITGAMYGIIFSSIADVSKEEDKAKNFGLIGAAFGIGFIVGPAIGGALSILPNWLLGCHFL
jgi:DHA1 family tetracycline resistance protein-like MFS transporter